MPPPLDSDKFPFKDYADQFFPPNTNITFQRDPLQSSLHNDPSMAKDAVTLSTLISTYTWNTNTTDKKKLTETEGVDITKTIL